MNSTPFMDKYKKPALWAIVAIVVLATLGGVYYNRTSKNSDQENGQGVEIADSESSPSSTPSSSKAVVTPKPTPKPAPRLVNDVTASSLTYTQAVAIFANTLIAFNEDCKIVPNPVYVQSGTTMMFDNRSRNTRTFKLDGTSYTIPGYGFKLFQLRSTKLPHVVKVECGPNSGEITLR